MTTPETRHRKKRVRKVLWHIGEMEPREVLAFCPRCKALETMRFNGQTLIPTRRYAQRIDGVYHLCGSRVPCRLFTLV